MTPRLIGDARRRRWLSSNAWPFLLLQRTAAATVAWVVALYVVRSPDPFFAPISAVIALDAPLGERGVRALRLLLGVVVGIAVGEVVAVTLGSGFAALAVATFSAMAVARALGGAPIIVSQAAGSAILAVTVVDSGFGVSRLLDALIGGGVALVFSQVIFSPEPVRLLRSAEAAALRGMADGLGMAAEGAEGDDEQAERAVTQLRELRDRLAELARLRQAGPRVARHSAIWRSQIAPVVQESEQAGHLDLLGGSCVLLARVAAAMAPPAQATLAPALREFADILTDLANGLGERSTRQSAADRALETVRALVSDEHAVTPLTREGIMAARMVAADIMAFAGVDPDDAIVAARDGSGGFNIPAPAPTPRLPFRLRRRRSR